MAEVSVSTVVVGTSFRGSVAIEAVSQMRAGSVIRLEREPQNQHDPLAVACHYLGQHVGFIPRQANRRIAEALDQGLIVHCTVREPPVVRRNRIVAEPKVAVRWTPP